MVESQAFYNRYGDESAEKDTDARPNRTGGQNGAVGAKRNNEQQYHAGGIAHDPHNRTQQRIDSGDPCGWHTCFVPYNRALPRHKTWGSTD